MSLTGSGPEVHLDAFGTGFLVSTIGQIQGLEPTIAEMTAYFPGITHGIAISTEKVSSAADVAILKGNVSELGIKQVTC